LFFQAACSSGQRADGRVKPKLARNLAIFGYKFGYKIRWGCAMDVFQLRDKIICGDYAKYTSSFVEISDRRIRDEVESKFMAGLLWPEPLLQLN